MSIKFDLSVTSQSSVFFEDLKAKASKKLIKFSEKHTNLARFTGLPIALCSSLLDIAQTVSNIGESLIKGLANIFGSPFSKKCSFLKGVKQLFLQVPLKVLEGVLSLPFSLAYEVLVRPVGTLISPTYFFVISNQTAKAKKLQLENSLYNPGQIELVNQTYDLLYR